MGRGDTDAKKSTANDATYRRTTMTGGYRFGPCTTGPTDTSRADIGAGIAPKTDLSTDLHTTMGDGYRNDPRGTDPTDTP